jgi:hypothetical protein
MYNYIRVGEWLKKTKKQISTPITHVCIYTNIVVVHIIQPGYYTNSSCSCIKLLLYAQPRSNWTKCFKRETDREEWSQFVSFFVIYFPEWFKTHNTVRAWATDARFCCWIFSFFFIRRSFSKSSTIYRFGRKRVATAAAAVVRGQGIGHGFSHTGRRGWSSEYYNLPFFFCCYYYFYFRRIGTGHTHIRTRIRLLQSTSRPRPETVALDQPLL